MSFSVFEKIDPSCQNGSMEKAKNLPYHQRPYASIAERTLVDISIYSPRPQIAGTGHSHSKISIHSPRMGRDEAIERNAVTLFQSTLPAWGETDPSPPLCALWQDFNPLSPHGERRRFLGPHHFGDHFNPLSPHGERHRKGADWSAPCDFNPLSPHGERHQEELNSVAAWKFQSTLPAWGETLKERLGRGFDVFQSTLPA